MKLYEIPRAIEELIDPETGEITDEVALQKLTESFENGIEFLALEVKNLNAEAAALKAEKEAFAKRQKTAENAAARLKNYISFLLGGEKYKTDKVAISFRKSEQVQVSDEQAFMDWALKDGDSFLRYKDPEIDKAALKDAIKDGQNIPYVSIVVNNNIQIR